MRVVILILMIYIGASGGGASAQNSLNTYILDAAEIGPDWRKVAFLDPAMIDSDLSDFAQTLGALYAGPDGARVVVIAFLPGDSPFAAWEKANTLYNNYAVDFAGFGDLTEDVRAPGCVEAKTMPGVDRSFPLPGAVILCARDDSDAFLIIAASGEIAGVSGLGAARAVLVAINNLQ